MEGRGCGGTPQGSRRFADMRCPGLGATSRAPPLGALNSGGDEKGEQP
jgi:hypothetical protein